MPTIKKFHFFKLFFQLTIQFSPTGSRPVQLGWARMGLMSQGKYPSTQSHYPGKINTKGNCYCHRLLHPWRGGTHYPIKKQTKSTRILKIILSDLIIIVMVIITIIMMMMMMTMILMIIMLSHSCPIHPLVTQGVLQKLNLI